MRLSGDWGAKAPAVLSASEQERASRYLSDVHRRAYILTRMHVRAILGQYLDVAANEISFGAGRHGKPYLHRDEGDHPVRFNLSHSGDLALLAVSREREVGVDLERWRENVAFGELATRFFSSSEHSALHQLTHDTDALLEAFYTVWARKEAYIKATGDGITRGLSTFDVSHDTHGTPLFVRDRRDPSATTRWTMMTLSVAPGYSAALVVAAPIGAVTLIDAVEP